MSYHHSKLVIRITVLGDKGVGKTSLVKSYLGKSCGEDYALMDTAYTCDAVIESTNVTQQILDSDGKNSAVTAWAHGVIIVYAANKRESFEKARELIETTKSITMKNATIMLVANKVDLPERKVSLEEGQKLATHSNCNYIELSALQNDGAMKSVFYSLSHEIIEKRGLRYKHHSGTPQRVRRVFQALTHYRDKRRSYTSYI